MAWFSSGSTNDELVSNLISNDCLKDDTALQQAFYTCDRKLFATLNRQLDDINYTEETKESWNDDSHESSLRDATLDGKLSIGLYILSMQQL